MMSNCAFWSQSGELLAVHGVDAAVPADEARASFGSWAASLRLPSGRLVALSPSFPLSAPGVGWNALTPEGSRKGRRQRACNPGAPVATAAPAFDQAAARLVPALVQHEKFTFKSWPTWVASVRLEREEGVEGWYAALGDSKTPVFLVRLLAHKHRLPGEGWRNMLAWSLKSWNGVRLVPLNGLPRAEVLDAFPAWEYRIEAGKGADSAAWDVQFLPSREWYLREGAGPDPWEATARLRWIRSELLEEREPAGEPRWADLFARWSAADARLVVQNVLNTLPGGAAASAALFFDTVILSPSQGRTLVRHVPQEGLPLALLSTLWGRGWAEVERAKRFLPPEDERKALRTEALAEVDRRLVEGRLLWSPEAQRLWDRWYRQPLEAARRKALVEKRQSPRWQTVLAGDPRIAESLLRNLDVTDAALCLRDAPDTRWRRFVTARREAELREEMEFCRVWEARGELTTERELEAWRAWDEVLETLPLTEGRGGN